MSTGLDLARIAEATQVVDPVFRDSPQFMSGQLSGVLGRNVLVKIETVNPLGSFKGRGADFLMRSLPRGAAVVCASSGNFGVALAYAGRTRGVRVRVFASPGIRRGRLARMRGLGAEVTVDDGDPAAAARACAAGRMRGIVDNMVLVTDSSLRYGMGLAARSLGLLVEPSGAAGLAAIARHDLPGEIIATVLTGAATG